ncbi:MAG TPA: winged helix-turn-helix domain-containing protein [Candidatus Dormibacteraeota bacterium]|nr:winged helix-turn-helix domain-containing protein [Candidatus Dormibacteraeota bacterium]
MLFAGIGWLAREDKLTFTTEGRSVRVCLREHQRV